MPGDPVRIDLLEVTMPGTRPDEGRGFGEALARELQQVLPGESGGHIGRIDIRVPATGDAGAVARAIRDAIHRSCR
jgi:hypothetical protein